MEETASSSNTKVSNDSAYSTCSNSQSRQSGSSKSHHSASSTSSGYGGHPSSSTLGSGSNDQLFPEPAKKNKIKDHKKKKLKSCNTTPSSTITTPPASTPTIVEEASATSPTKTIPSDTVLSSIITNGATPSAENELLQMAALSQTLLCFKKMKSKDLQQDLPTSNLDEEQLVRTTDQKTDETSPKEKEKEFCVVVSMHDGIVLYTSSGLTNVLGFHKDMWLGRSFTDFVHPKDRLAFVSHVTSKVTKPFLDTQFSADSSSSNKHTMKNSTFYCHLRCYRGLQSSGFNIIDRDVKYIACQFTLSFKEIVANSESSCFLNSPHGIFSVINIQPVFTAYTSNNEVLTSPKFMTRHLANGLYCHVDSLVVSYLGYLPQDMINNSIFNFYCPDDLPMLKEVYKEVMSEQGQLVSSKPYKFKCQNGSYLIVETEWSTFINPWSKNLEFVIGQHKVVQGPANIDVTTPVKAEETPAETDSHVEISKKEILEILQKPVNVSNRIIKVQVSKRCKDLASFIETLVEEITKPETKTDTQKDANESERDSMMLGEISPHHEYGSKVSSETPPSYTQLNYNENIQRFFESQPKTSFSGELSESKGISSTIETSEGNEESSSSLPSNSKDRKCENSNKNNTTSSSSRSSKGSSRNANKTFKKNKIEYQPPPLTAEILSRHNEDMEKQMIIKHQAQRGKMLKVKTKPQNTKDETHGMKRSGSHSWDNGPYRRSMKQIHVNDQLHDSNGQSNRRSVVPVAMQTTITDGYNTPEPGNVSNLTFWPMFSYSGSMLQPETAAPGGTPSGIQTNIPAGIGSGIPAVMPVLHPTSLPPYYIPREQQVRPEHAGPPYPPFAYISSHQAHVMSPMIHPNWTGYTPMFYAPCPVIPSLSNLGSKSVMTRSSDFNQPLSRATSIKAEPGSARSSYILMQSDASKKGGFPSMSSNNYSPGAFPGSKDNGNKEESGELSFSETGDESSYYSSFYSFLKTEEKMDDSMRSSSGDDAKKYEDELWGILNGTNEDDGKKFLRKGPVWLEGVDITPELQFRYQISTKGITDVLQADMEALAKLNQPDLVNEQLSTLYLELEGIYSSFKLEDSSSSGEEGNSNKTRKRKPFNYDKMVMIFEEEAPLPPPVTTAVPVALSVAAASNI